jgi:hypothetical protein
MSAREASTPDAEGSPPPWFRVVVWDSLLGASCQLLPLPLVDDLALARVRRRMVGRLAAQWGARVAPYQLAHLAGRGRRWTLGRFAGKVVVYPLKKLFRKVFYFLAVKDAVDTFSQLFHHGYLVHAALVRGALGGPGVVSDERVAAVAGAVHGTLQATNTGPLRRVVVGVLRNSRRLVAATLSWLASRLARGRGEGLEQVEEAGATGSLAAGSPEAEQLLDRLLVVLWGEEGYRRRLEQELERRLP